MGRRQLNLQHTTFAKVGEKVTGVLEGFSETTVRGTTHPVWILRQLDGKRIKVRERSQLKDLVTDENIGELITIEYKGDETTANGNTVKLFDVYAEEAVKVAKS